MKKKKKKKCGHNGHKHSVGGQFWHPEIFPLLPFLDFFFIYILKGEGKEEKKKEKKVIFFCLCIYIYICKFLYSCLACVER